MAATLLLPQSRKVACGAQLPGKGLLALSSFQAFDEQFLDFVGRSAPGRLQQAGLDPQHLGDGPAFTGLVRNGESFFDDIQCGIAAACLSVSLGFDREKDWEPQACAGLAPGR